MVLIGNGNHWLGLKIENRDCAYFDSYGILPREEIIYFCKRIPKSHLSYNTEETQDISAETCGFYAIAFLLFLNSHNSNNYNLHQKSSSFSNLFSFNPKKKNKKLQDFYRQLPVSSYLKLMNKLYSQK